MGIGMLGGSVGTAQFFSERGTRVLVTDLKSKDELKSSLDRLADYPIEYVLGEHRDQDFIETDMVIRNPAVPEDSKYLQIARDHHVPVEMAESLFLKLSTTKQIIGVTGTRGKSTTTAMIHHILKLAGKDVYLAGNQKNTSTLLLLNMVTKDSIVVLELSSWQTESFGWHTMSPHIAVITNIYPDHLNRYTSMEQYINAKSNIFRFQKKSDYLVLNKDVEQLTFLAKKAASKVLWFSRWEYPRYNMKLYGNHNQENAAAARSVCSLYAIDEQLIRKVIETFSPLSGRLEKVGTISGVDIINDTASTTPVAGIRALESFPRKKIIMILGGNNKKLPLEDLRYEINLRAKAVVLIPGTGTEEIRPLLEKSKHIPSISSTNTLLEAIHQALDVSQPGDVILFSPSFTSFGQFKNEFERGEVFNDAANKAITAHREKTDTRRD